MNKCECKNCLHEDVCYAREVYGKLEKDEDCKSFKDKSLCVELPCKVGDTLYFPISHRVLAYDVISFKYDGQYVKVVMENRISKSQMTLYKENVGKTVFLTKAEAERKLREVGE